MARYIDADKMREEWLENGENEFIYDTNSVLDSIDSQPTADVAPVKHGEWLDNHNGTYTCSVCGGKASKMIWCGRCGAKMKGGEG